jgi:hypothetical protein
MAAGDDLLLFGIEPGGEPPRSNRIIGARLHVASGTWSDLPPAPGEGFELPVLDGVAASGVTKHPPGSAPPVITGGIFDLQIDAWRPLPLDGWPPAASVKDPITSRGGLVGVLRQATAAFVPGYGAVLDVEGQRWIEMLPLDDRTGQTVTAVGRRLFQLGGVRQGQGLNDAWVWTPTSGVAPSRTTAPPASVAMEVPTTTPPPPPPPAGPTTGAPQYLSAKGDASAGRISVRFDRPVTGDPSSYPPGGGPIPQDKTSPMNLIVFGADSGCSTPAGNAHEYLEGLGTDTITTDATSLVRGTTYIGIGAGFVKNVADGTFNTAAVSCLPISVT